jgi:antitoxin (DNA-binding transcriptional repressor) of toxin-antitoxin stability system
MLFIFLSLIAIIIAIIIVIITEEMVRMKFITVTELKSRATQIVSEIESTKEQVIVTKNGKPVVLMRAITDQVFRLDEAELKREEKKYG